MNDLAADLLSPADGTGMVGVVGELAPGLRELLARGIERYGEVVVFAEDALAAAGAPGRAFDLTGWECDTSSFHLDDVVPMTTTFVDHVPSISLEPAHIRCIVGANNTGGTFRFHRVRPDEEVWADTDLDMFLSDFVIVVDSPDEVPMVRDYSPR